MIRSINGKTPRIAASAFVSEAAYVVGASENGSNRGPLSLAYREGPAEAEPVPPAEGGETPVEPETAPPAGGEEVPPAPEGGP